MNPSCYVLNGWEHATSMMSTRRSAFPFISMMTLSDRSVKFLNKSSRYFPLLPKLGKVLFQAGGKFSRGKKWQPFGKFSYPMPDIISIDYNDGYNCLVVDQSRREAPNGPTITKWTAIQSLRIWRSLIGPEIRLTSVWDSKSMNASTYGKSISTNNNIHHC